MEPFKQQREEFGGEPEPAMPETTEAARKLAEELRVDLTVVQGTGSNGRVTRDDVEAHAEKLRDAQGDDLDPTGEQDGEPHDDQSREPTVPGASAPPPVQVEPPPSAEGCIRFHCPTNPNFNLQSHKLGGTIRFTDGCYETDDAAEIAALRAQQCVEEVAG